MNIGSWIVARAKEGSTWAGLGGVIAGLTFLPHAKEVGALMPSIGVVVAGVIAIILPN